MAAAPTITPVLAIDDAPVGTLANAGGSAASILQQQLQIMNVLLREGFGLTGLEGNTLVQQSVPLLSPSIAVITQP